MGLAIAGAACSSLGESWRMALPDTEFLCPDAPFAYDGMPMPDARQWFSLQKFTLQEMIDGTKLAAPYQHHFIDNILETRNLPPEKIALVGFSQGTIMSLYAAPRREKPVAGILGYSGLLVGSETLIAENKSRRPLPSFMAQQITWCLSG